MLWPGVTPRPVAARKSVITGRSPNPGARGPRGVARHKLPQRQRRGCVSRYTANTATSAFSTGLRGFVRAALGDGSRPPGARGGPADHPCGAEAPVSRGRSRRPGRQRRRPPRRRRPARTRAASAPAEPCPVPPAAGRRRESSAPCGSGGSSTCRTAATYAASTRNAGVASRPAARSALQHRQDAHRQLLRAVGGDLAQLVPDAGVGEAGRAARRSRPRSRRRSKGRCGPARRHHSRTQPGEERIARPPRRSSRCPRVEPGVGEQRVRAVEQPQLALLEGRDVVDEPRAGLRPRPGARRRSARRAPTR